MRIRGRKSSADCSVSFSPSSSSSTSSYSSSITAANSSVPSQDSSNSSPFSLLEAASYRCRGLDLLVKAIHQVTAGSVVGVPYIQRRVAIRRRRRRSFMFDDFSKRRRETTEAKVSYNDNNIKIRKKKQTKIRLPTTIQDSVLRSCVRRSELAGEMGL